MEIGIGIGVAIAIILWLLLRNKTPQLSSEEARDLVKGGATLIDVRTPAEFKQGCIEGAQNIPVNEILKRSEELGAKESQIVLYCRSGTRSSGAQRILKKSGFKNVHNLGPMSKW